MHRSGTSVTARILNLLGAYLGPDDQMVPAATDNPRGFWEHRAIIELNDSILARFGGRSMAPPRFPQAWETEAQLDDLREIARSIVLSFAERELWAWKDPRACLTLPFWQTVMPPMRYLICVRNPLDVAQSLRARNRIRRGRSLAIWLLYMQSVLANTEGQRRRIVLYDSLIDDPLKELRELEAFLELPPRSDQAALQSELAAVVDRDLRHHRSLVTASLNSPDDERSAKAIELTERAYMEILHRGATECGQVIGLLNAAIDAAPPTWHPQ